MAERKVKAAEENVESSKAAETASVVSGEGAAPKGPKPTVAAPLTAPEPRVAARDDRPRPVPPNAVAPTAPHPSLGTRLLDEQGNELTLEDFLEYPSADAPRHEVGHPQIFTQDPKRLVTVTRRVFREYNRPGTKTPVTQLLYNAGARITKAEADRLTPEAMPSPYGAGD